MIILRAIKVEKTPKNLISCDLLKKFLLLSPINGKNITLWECYNKKFLQGVSISTFKPHCFSLKVKIFFFVGFLCECLCFHVPCFLPMYWEGSVLLTANTLLNNSSIYLSKHTYRLAKNIKLVLTERYVVCVCWIYGWEDGAIKKSICTHFMQAFHFFS